MSYAGTFEIDTPVCPEQAPGWECFVFRDLNLSWAVTLRNGYRVRRVGRLTGDEVRAFNAPKEWSKS